MKKIITIEIKTLVDLETDSLMKLGWKLAKGFMVKDEMTKPTTAGIKAEILEVKVKSVVNK